jgi:shikimate kinase
VVAVPEGVTVTIDGSFDDHCASAVTSTVESSFDRTTAVSCRVSPTAVNARSVGTPRPTGVNGDTIRVFRAQADW